MKWNYIQSLRSVEIATKKNRQQIPSVESSNFMGPSTFCVRINRNFNLETESISGFFFRFIAKTRKWGKEVQKQKPIINKFSNSTQRVLIFCCLLCRTKAIKGRDAMCDTKWPCSSLSTPRHVYLTSAHNRQTNGIAMTFASYRLSTKPLKSLMETICKIK